VDFIDARDQTGHVVSRVNGQQLNEVFIGSALRPQREPRAGDRGVVCFIRQVEGRTFFNARLADGFTFPPSARATISAKSAATNSRKLLPSIRTPGAPTRASAKRIPFST
jgi:hypothetical protein